MFVIHVRTSRHKNYSYTVSGRRVASEMNLVGNLPTTLSVTAERI